MIKPHLITNVKVSLKSMSCCFSYTCATNLALCLWDLIFAPTLIWRPTLLLSHPYFGQVWGWSPTLGKVRDLEFSGTLEYSELDNKGQNTLHWGVLGVIGKGLKHRYRKWPRIGNSNICSPSYGQKKGWESNYQFDSWPLKVGNRPLLDVRFECATWRWKDLDEGFGSNLNAIQLCSRELWRFKVPGVPPGQFRESREFVPFGCSLRDQP
jgi:hypothetical protein